MLKTVPYCANHVSVHPPLSQIRVGALLLTIRTGFCKSAICAITKSRFRVSSFSRESQILRERQDLPAVNCIHQRRHGDIPGAQPRDKDLPAR